MLSSCKTLLIFENQNGKSPFMDWFDKIKDKSIATRIMARLARVIDGNFGDCKSIGNGVYELRLAFGSGYRIYYANHGLVTVILLSGGDKKSQSKDIELAKKYWLECQERLKHEKEIIKSWKIL